MKWRKRFDAKKTLNPIYGRFCLFVVGRQAETMNSFHGAFLFVGIDAIFGFFCALTAPWRRGLCAFCIALGGLAFASFGLWTFGFQLGSITNSVFLELSAGCIGFLAGVILGFAAQAGFGGNPFGD